MSQNLDPEEGMNPIERGRSRYQKKNYGGALEAFTEAINISSDHLLFTALDHRAATFEKLDQLQYALRDAKQMLELKPELSKGYLRCAKILQLKGENELALKIYGRGQRKVKIGLDSDRVILQAQFTKLQQLLAPKKSLDPLAYLPVELAQMIVENLLMRDKVICLAVSKPWKRLLESSHKLWTTFDSSASKRSISKVSLKASLKRSNFTVDRAIIGAAAKLDAQKMSYLIKSCTKLAHLEFSGSAMIGDSLVASLPFAKSLKSLNLSPRSVTTPTCMEAALRCVKDTIVEANFLNISSEPYSQRSAWPRLEKLKVLRLWLPGPHKQTFNFDNLIEAIPNIEVLCAKNIILRKRSQPPSPDFDLDLDFTSLKALSHLQLQSGCLGFPPLLPPTLKTLSLNDCRFGKLWEEGEIAISELPLLENFDCEKSQLDMSTITAITQSANKAGNLKSLRIGQPCASARAWVIGGGVLQASLYFASESIEELSLAQVQLAENELLKVCDLLPSLRRLNISQTKITGVGVKHLVSKGIEWLNVDECAELGPDAVEFARSRGVEVSFKFPSTSKIRTYRDAFS